MRQSAGILAAALVFAFSGLLPLDAAAQRARGSRQAKSASSQSKKQKAKQGKSRKARAKRLHRQRSRRQAFKSERRQRQRARKQQNQLARSLRRKQQQSRQPTRVRSETSSSKQLSAPKAPKKLAERFRSAGLEGRSADVAAEHVALGLPSEASTEKAEDFLIAREEYVISYSKSRKTANWASWKLAKEHMGSTKRSGKFKTDTAIPASWEPPGKADYKNSGYTRGHLVSSGARTASPESNRKTFYFSNILPQTEAQNNGPWNKFEQKAREIAKQGKDVYMIAGPLYEGPTKTIGQRKVAVPSHIWKVAVVVKKGTPPGEIGADAKVISMLMPNDSSVKKNDSYQKFKVKPKEIQERAGVELFKNLPSEVRTQLLDRMD